jgi:hypothetical protein
MKQKIVSGAKKNFECKAGISANASALVLP